MHSATETISGISSCRTLMIARSLRLSAFESVTKAKSSSVSLSSSASRRKMFAIVVREAFLANLSVPVRSIIPYPSGINKTFLQPCELCVLLTFPLKFSIMSLYYLLTGLKGDGMKHISPQLIGKLLLVVVALLVVACLGRATFLTTPGAAPAHSTPTAAQDTIQFDTIEETAVPGSVAVRVT